MATSYKIILRKEKINGKGEHPLYLRITDNRKSSYKALGIYVAPLLWDDERQIVKRGYPNSARVNNLLTIELGKVQGKALEMATSNKEVSARRIKEAVNRKSSDSFIEYFVGYLDWLKRENKAGTYDKAWATLSKLKQYMPNRNLTFSDIDIDFLRAYERYLRDELGNSINTIHSNLKIFRKLFHQAYMDGTITAEQNSFLRYKLRTEKTNKDYITEDELARLEALEIPERYMMNHHRLMYIFACYSGGLRISDILQLRWRNFTGTHLVVNTHKTGEPVTIKLPKRALEIIDFYKPLTSEKTENFIFPCLNNEADYTDSRVLFRALSSGTAYANKNLKTLAQRAGIDKSISFHTSRHTFATRALRKGVRMEYVSKLMGHTTLKTTQIYAKIVNEELDKAMEVFD
ncbi:site-specific integrase [Spirosoma terrae]|uniref:Site-specific integrase n=1 Tax=Spirosoma terrae TaxID=1968276 RepID=A0A6L9LF63_9BACT|nr:site-specific integrase [Spirosoma terrae]NDU99216.1 site-specific integrase [Spirosoma terrae]